MDAALAEAALAPAHGDVPIGAVVADAAGQIIAVAHNERELTGDPTAHAEVLAIRRAAAAVGSWHLDGCTLAVTLEPCPMCAGALWAARVTTLVFAAFDPKAGAAASLYDIPRDPRLNHRLEVISGIHSAAATDLLEAFFAKIR
ncbi:MAG: nucleoside deaminase [Propionibacteriaceae bacterium]|nr:nucleoside deaminase [Propionibacteriaceae bacterium]